MTTPPVDEKASGFDRPNSASSTRTGRAQAVADVPVENGIKEHYGETQRGLSPRHVQLMAIGGSIGVGIWVGIGSVLVRAGPLSLLLGYIFWGFLFVWPLQLCVAEMIAYLPIRGTIFELAARYVDPALGFAMGWTYCKWRRRSPICPADIS
jgi:amino acid transporter